MTQAASLRSAAVFSVVALVLILSGAAVIIFSSGAGAQDPLETFSHPTQFRSLLEAADPALRYALFLDGLFAISYAGATCFAAIGFRDHCLPAAWASGLCILATMVLDIAENLLLLGSLDLAGAGLEIDGERIALHVFISGMKLHVAAVSLVAFSFVLPKRGIVTFLMRWGSRTIMPLAAILFVTGAFGMRAEASSAVFIAMVGGFVLLPIVALGEARGR